MLRRFHVVVTAQNTPVAAHGFWDAAWAPGLGTPPHAPHESPTTSGSDIVRHRLSWLVDQSFSGSMTWKIAGVFAILASLVSLYQIRMHVKWNANSHQRKYILRILMMVPIYALESWLGLRFKSTAVYFDAMRDCYESLVIYSFYCFLVEYLGGERHLIRILRGKPQQEHIFPFCCLDEWKMGSDFLYHCKVGILQFVVFKPLMAILSFAFDSLDMYYSGSINFGEAYPYILFIDNVSQTIAIYCLILFYFAVQEELAPVNPVPKFAVVKSVVFATYWQAVALTILFKSGFIYSSQDGVTPDDIIAAVQDFFVCVEMFIASIAHHYAFSYKEFHDPSRTALAPPIIRSLFQAVDVTDVFVDDVEDALNPARPLASAENSPLLVGVGSQHAPHSELEMQSYASSNCSTPSRVALWQSQRAEIIMSVPHSPGSPMDMSPLRRALRQGSGVPSPLTLSRDGSSRGGTSPRIRVTQTTTTTTTTVHEYPSIPMEAMKKMWAFHGPTSSGWPRAATAPDSNRWVRVPSPAVTVGNTTTGASTAASSTDVDAATTQTTDSERTVDALQPADDLNQRIRDWARSSPLNSGQVDGRPRRARRGASVMQVPGAAASARALPPLGSRARRTKPRGRKNRGQRRKHRTHES